MKEYINKIINADCMDILKQLPDKCIDLSFTSPPYNSLRFKKYKNYEDNQKEYFDFLKNFTDELIRITKENVIINIQSNYYNKIDVYKYIGHYADKIDRTIIWKKTNPAPSSLINRLTNAYEFFFVFNRNHSVKINSISMQDVIEYPINTEKFENHKAVMNIDICKLIIKEFSKRDDIILDCFSGSGTTAIACHNLKRNFICIEKDYDYWKASVERLENAQSQMKLF